MCFGVCLTKDIGRFSKTFIKSKMHLALPTPSCVVNDFGMPTLPLYSQSHLLFSWDGAKFTVISIHRCEQRLTLPEPRGTCVLQAVRRDTFFPLHSNTFLLPWPCVLFQSLDSSLVRIRGVVSWHPRGSWAPKQAYKSQKLEPVWLCWFLHVTVEHTPLKCSLTLDPCSQVHTLLLREPLLVCSCLLVPKTATQEGLPSILIH